MTQSNFNMYGAVDLSGLSKGPVRPTGGPVAAAAEASVVVDVTEADFESVVIDQSMTVPVVIDFWAEWCGPCKSLSPILERLAHADEGRWMLAKVDVDSNPRLGQAFQVKGIPAVFAVVGGQPVPLFQGALPEAQVRQYLDELLKLAEANGLTGRIVVGDAPPEAPPDEEADDTRYDEAYDAIERGDLEAAATAYRGLLADNPLDADAQAGLGQVELLARTQSIDPAAARSAAGQQPDNVELACQVADLDLLGGHVDDAFSRLIELVRRAEGDDRDRARTHLVGLFDLVGNQDDRVIKARTALANALF